MRRHAIALSLLIISAAAPAAQATQTRVETARYIAANDSLTNDCSYLEEPHGIGGACFRLLGNETTMVIRVDDDRSPRVAANYRITNGATLHTSGTFCGESAPIEIDPAALALEVQPLGPAWGPILCGLDPNAIATSGTITVTHTIVGPPTRLNPPRRDCLQHTPAAFDNPAAPAAGSVDLSVHVLLDNVEESEARDAFARATEAYAPLDITLRPVAFEPVTFTSNVARELIDAAKGHVGGVPPEGVDIVFLLTDKRMVSKVQFVELPGVAGLADCIGGIRFPEHSFAVSSTFDLPEGVGPVETYQHPTARVLAHEIGHLLGAHHHYANCAEGAPGDTDSGEITPCTLMYNEITFMSLRFSTLNASVVRGHALAYATGND